MGMFTRVKVHKSLLPKKYKKLTSWQTKGVIDPIMGTLKVNKNGQLKYIWHKYAWNSETKNFI